MRRAAFIIVFPVNGLLVLSRSNINTQELFHHLFFFPLLLRSKNSVRNALEGKELAQLKGYSGALDDRGPSGLLESAGVNTPVLCSLRN